MSQIVPLSFNNGEIFPFFHWSLFSETGGEYWQYYIYFNKEKCELKECIFLNDSVKDEEVYWLIQDMGNAYDSKNSEFPFIKEKFERLIQPTSTIHSYELRLRKFFPLSYYLEKKIKEDVFLIKFEGNK